MLKKLLLRIFVMLLSFVGSFSLLSCQMNRDPVIATVNGTSIYNRQFREMFDEYASMFGISDPTASENSESFIYLRDYVVNYLIDEQLMLDKAKELGYDRLTDDEQKSVDEEIDLLFQSWYDSFKTSLAEDGNTYTSEELDKKIQLMIDERLKANHITKSYIREYYTKLFIIEKLYNALTSDITVSDEQLKSTYDERVRQIQQIYADDTSIFETDYMQSETTIYYIPKGYREVKHILIALPNEVQEEIYSLRMDNNDKEANRVRTKALADIHDKAQNVLDLLSPDGSNFEQIMLQYNDDAASNSLPNGYAVHKNGSFVPEFANAVFSLKKPGTISGLVISDYGYHIILYVQSLKEGAVPFEVIKDSLSEELLGIAKDNAYSTLLTQWRETATIKVFPEAIDYRN